jgi:hypothetical protein
LGLLFLIGWIGYLSTCYIILVIILRWIAEPALKYNVLVLKRGFKAAVFCIISLMIIFFTINQLVGLNLRKEIILALILVGIFGGMCLHRLGEIQNKKDALK